MVDEVLVSKIVDFFCFLEFSCNGLYCSFGNFYGHEFVNVIVE